MANEVKLGKIPSAKFGAGGYQDAQIGLWLTIDGKGWGVGHAIVGGWNFPPDKNAKWSLEDQTVSYAEMVREKLSVAMTAAWARRKAAQTQEHK